MRRLIGAHDVPAEHLYAVAWVSGVFSTFWAILAGVWFLGPPGSYVLHSQPWLPLLQLVGDYRMVGAIMLTGGFCGVLGLVTRRRWISLLSCIICTAWSGWLLAFLWFSNFQGDYSSGSIFGILSGAVFIFRFWLLFAIPKPGDKRGAGW